MSEEKNDQLFSDSIDVNLLMEIYQEAVNLTEEEYQALVKELEEMTPEEEELLKA